MKACASDSVELRWSSMGAFTSCVTVSGGVAAPRRGHLAMADFSSTARLRSCGGRTRSCDVDGAVVRRRSRSADESVRGEAVADTANGGHPFSGAGVGELAAQPRGVRVQRPRHDARADAPHRPQ